ncbi:3-deoxy-7-phosphoheptulonate synthase [Myxococcaceae bacterium]|jgi:3-deoxy-7-phosphoheptulonate synthase|nr:3-deoxy-7-phosphoheptulonate synthase [Myxococcaceae bacterium]
MHFRTDDLRIENLKPLIPPAILMEELPLDDAGSATVSRSREQIVEILAGRDDRLLVVVGPCSIHDPVAGLEYAQRLAKVADEHRGDLFIVMRVYFEKPRSTVGWKGLLNDPHLDGSFAINHGLRTGRRFLLDVTRLGLPAGCEFLDPISPQFLADVVSWGAIGARTSESQVHRELASGLSMPVGFKNGTDGKVQIALDAILASAHPHHFLSVTKQGVAAIFATRGNPDCHLILRGGASGPNYDAAQVRQAVDALARLGLPARVMIDCSHGNSAKDHRRQPEVVEAVAEQLAAGSRSICGVMLESFLVDGRQDFGAGGEAVYGQSITDACMGWERTTPLFGELGKAVRKRRTRR